MIKPEKETEDSTYAYLRPKDAATLILIDRSAETPKVLVGKRHDKVVFQPGKFVFPGGRVDATDNRIPVAAEIPKALEAKLDSRRKEAELLRSRIQSCDEAQELFRTMRDAAIRECEKWLVEIAVAPELGKGRERFHLDLVLGHLNSKVGDEALGLIERIEKRAGKPKRCTSASSQPSSGSGKAVTPAIANCSRWRSTVCMASRPGLAWGWDAPRAMPDQAARRPTKQR